MATRLYGISRGYTDFGNNTIEEVAGSATVADNVEVTVDLAVGLTKQEVILALQAIQRYILKDTSGVLGG